MPDDLARRAPTPEPDWITRAADERGFAWARIAWNNAAAQPGAWFDHGKADAIVALWPRLFKLTEDPFAGQTFRLVFWQEVVVRLLVGWKRPVARIDPDTGATTFQHGRLFRELRLWVPRKNGKSEFLAALALLFWLIEGGRGGQGFCFARDREQASIVFQKMKNMLAQSPAMARLVQPFAGHLFQPESQSTFVRLTGKAEGKHGRSPTVIVGDEMHEWPSREQQTTLRQGTGARLEPMELYASTAGLNTNQVGGELYRESLSILDKRIDSPSTLVVVFCAGETDDPFDEATWKKANPMLGFTPSWDFMRREAATARTSPRALAHFKCYHLGIWVDETSAWLKMPAWDRCRGAGDWRGRHNRAEWRGHKAHGGFDLASTDDLCALVWRLAPVDGGPARLACRFWMPEGKLREREQTGRVPWRAWVETGAIETTPGDVIDQAYIERAILDGFEQFDVIRLGYDHYNAWKMVGDLQTKGIAAERMMKIIQGVRSMGAPTKAFETLVGSGGLDHGGHPVLRWMAGHGVVRFDENLNYMPAKKASAEKIDGLVAAVMAEAVAAQPEQILRADDLAAQIA